MIRTLLLSLMLAAMALWSSVSFAAYRWTITQLTNDETDQCEAHIGNDGKVAWSTSCNSDLTGGLYYYDGTSSWPVSESDSLRIWQLDMNDTGSVIWVESGLIASVIMLFDGAETVMLNIGNYPRINNLGHAVWDTQYPYADREILFFNGSLVTPETSNEITDRYGVINDNDVFCWTAWDPDAEIVCQNGPDGTTTVITDNDIDDWYQEINNSGQLAWMGGECPLCEIYFFDGEDIHRLTTNSHDDRNPRINDLGQVTWWGMYGPNQEDIKVFLFDGVEIREIGAGNARYPDINDTGMVTWQQQEGDDLDIFVLDGTQTYQITKDFTYNDERPRINDNGAIVWRRYDGVDYEIMIADSALIPEAQWAKTLGGLDNDQAMAVEITPEGGYIVLGETDSFGTGGKDLWIVKLDWEGTMLWQKTYGGEGHESAAAIRPIADGGYLVAGTTASTPSGENDAWMLKIDEAGAVDWSRRYGGTANDFAVDVIDSGDGNFLVGGTTSDSNMDESDIWLMKLDPYGDVIWRKTYNSSSSSYDRLSSIQKTWSGGYIMAGVTHHYPERVGDFWVLKIDHEGTVEWEKAYGLDVFVAPGAPRNENIEYKPSIQQTLDGGFILAGTTVSWTNKHMVWVLKLMGDGSITWQKLFSTGADCDLSSVHQDEDGGYLLSGATGPTGDGWLMKLDQDGVQEWVHYYGGEGFSLTDKISYSQNALDGGCIAIGYTESLAASDEDLWILKLDHNGHIPGCPAIHAGYLTAEADPTEAPLDVSSVVDDTFIPSIEWTVAVTEPPSLHILEGDGCNPAAIVDLIDLARTGQTTPYHAGDDGHIQAGVPWPSPRFVDNGNGTVTDNLTGLIWLKDANCLGTAYWEDAMNNVASFNADPTAFMCVDYDSDSHPGDWRAPNINEIESLINAQVSDNAAWLTSQAFVNVTPDQYWSSSTPSYTYRRWTIDMEDGKPARGYGTGWHFRMWPVRGGQNNYWNPNFPANIWKTGQTASFYPGDDGDLQMGVFWPSQRFQDNEDGTVTDNLTGLVWLKDTHCFEDTDSFKILSWQDGLDAVADFNTHPEDYDCAEYNLENHQEGWRVPNKKELLSIMDRSREAPALPIEHPFIDIDSRIYWTSTTYPNDPSSPAAWVAYPLGLGALSTFLKNHGQPTVWPVRGEIHAHALRDADIDGDGDVDGGDLAILAAAFGAHFGDANFDPRADLIMDEVIDQADLQAFASRLGRTDCPCQ
jgi:hypothetical protein